jgi:hypothetical protein
MIIGIILLSGLLLFLLYVRLYGIYLSFKKKWYIGTAALVVPFFADVVGIAKILFKKDLLK